MRKGQYEVFTFSRKHICVSLDDSTLKKSTRTSPNPATMCKYNFRFFSYFLEVFSNISHIE